MFHYACSKDNSITLRDHDHRDDRDHDDDHNHDDDDDDQVITENQCRSMCLPWEWRPVSSLDCDRVAE